MEFWDDEAVTPVVGTVLVLLITMMGIGGILAWGAPAIQTIQDQSASAAIEGEFSDLRLNTLVLRIVDSSRVPVVPLTTGDLSQEDGSRFGVLVILKDPSNEKPECRIRITGWTQVTDTFHVDGTNCGNLVGSPGGDGEFGIRVDEISGGTYRPMPVDTPSPPGGQEADVTVPGADFSEGDWRIQFIDNEGDIRVQFFILTTQRLVWHLGTSVSDTDLILEGGALFRRDGVQVFNLASAQISEDFFSSGDYFLKLPTYSGPERTASAPASPSVFLQLQGNHLRVGGQDTLRIRFDVAGDLAEAWCNHLLFRNLDLTTGTYDDSDATCEDGDAYGVRSVTYEPEPAGGSFPFEFIHARVHAEIVT